MLELASLTWSEANASMLARRSFLRICYCGFSWCGAVLTVHTVTSRFGLIFTHLNLQPPGQVTMLTNQWCSRYRKLSALLQCSSYRLQALLWLSVVHTEELAEQQQYLQVQQQS